MDNPILVHPKTIVNWDESAWESFIPTVDAIAASPDNSWKLLMLINESFGALSLGCQRKALVAADRLILQIREGMEQIMSTLQDTYQDAYIPEDPLEINLHKGGNQDETEENQGALGGYGDGAN